MVSRFKSTDDLSDVKLTIAELTESEEDIPAYLAIEDNYVAFLKTFFDFCQSQAKKKFGHASLAWNFYTSEAMIDSYPQLHFGLNDIKNRLADIEKRNINTLNDEDLTFVFRCWMREFCNLTLVDITSGSRFFGVEDLTFIIALNENLTLQEIFSPNPNIYFLPNIDDDTDEFPENYHVDIQL